jgi:hypothetical protein
MNHKCQALVSFIVCSGCIIVFYFICNKYQINKSHNNNIISENTNVKNYSIELSQCSQSHFSYICYKGSVITFNNCSFEMITDSIYENVEEWLYKYYPKNKEITVDYNTKLNKCDNYIDLFWSYFFLSTIGISVLLSGFLFVESLFRMLKTRTHLILSESRQV